MIYIIINISFVIMNKGRIENFLMSLETNGMLTGEQQSMVLQSELDMIGGANTGDCTNKVAETCGGVNSVCANFGVACGGGLNSKCSNEPIKPVVGPGDHPATGD